jgi:RNA polymerase sigma-70 factor, ECF subfamily
MVAVLQKVTTEPVRARSVVNEPVNLNFLMERIAGGDKGALKALYKLIAPRLSAVLARMVRRQEVADELLQDVFVTVWSKAGQFDVRRGSAEVWLFSVARRKAIDRLRISRREVLGLEEDIATLEPQSDIHCRGTDMETSLAVKRCIADLTPEVKKAMQLCYTFGLTHEELAEVMKVPVGTAKSWVRKGVMHLKDCLQDYGRT